MNTDESFLSPYRVLDLTDEKGYMCGKILGGLGAEVIKIDPPEGDQGRNMGPFIGDKPGADNSLPWIAFNVNKKSITLDLETGEGKNIFSRLGSGLLFMSCSVPSSINTKYGRFCQGSSSMLLSMISLAEKKSMTRSGDSSRPLKRQNRSCSAWP